MSPPVPQGRWEARHVTDPITHCNGLGVQVLSWYYFNDDNYNKWSLAIADLFRSTGEGLCLQPFEQVRAGAGAYMGRDHSVFG